MRKNLKPDELLKIGEIVETQGWQYTSSRKRPGAGKLVEDIYEFCLQFSEADLPLYLDLLKNYKTHFDPYPLAHKSANLLMQKHKEGQILIASNTVNQDDFKSGESATYNVFIQCEQIEKGRVITASGYDSDRFIEWEGPKYLVDDFIGSGRQTMRVIRNIVDNGMDAPGVLSYVAHTKAIELFRSNSVTLLYATVAKRGISDLQETFSVLKGHEINDEIETQMQAPVSCHRGFRECEALISMSARTPNNTLPVFWSEGREGSWNPLFSR